MLVQHSGTAWRLPLAKYKVPHLVRRGGNYYFRVAVPRPLRDQFGRRELKLSLLTHDPKVARMRCVRLSSCFVQLIARIESMTEMTQDQINQVVRAYFAREMS